MNPTIKHFKLHDFHSVFCTFIFLVISGQTGVIRCLKNYCLVLFIGLTQFFFKQLLTSGSWLATVLKGRYILIRQFQSINQSMVLAGVHVMILLINVISETMHLNSVLIYAYITALVSLAKVEKRTSMDNRNIRRKK